MKYLVGNSMIDSRREAILRAIEWWATACGTQEIGDPSDWPEEEIRDFLPGYAKVFVDPGDGIDEEAEQAKLDEEVVATAVQMARAARAHRMREWE